MMQVSPQNPFVQPQQGPNALAPKAPVTPSAPVAPVQFSGESWDKIKVIYQAQTPQTKGVIKAVGAGTVAVATVFTPLPFLIGVPVAAWMGFSAYKSIKED